MKFQLNGVSHLWYYVKQVLYLIPIAVIFHYCKLEILNKVFDKHYNDQTTDVASVTNNQYKELFYELALLRKQIINIREELNDVVAWKIDLYQHLDSRLDDAFDRFYSDQIGIFDYASEYAGGFILSTPDTMSYPSKRGIRLFGAIDWIVESPPNILLQPTISPGKCYAFYGNKGRIRVGLGRPVVVTHVSLDYMRIGETLNSAPKDFQVLGDGVVNLGLFVYDLRDQIVQTFKVAAFNQTFKSVELRILSNHGSDEYTCLYRFRVHSVLY